MWQFIMLVGLFGVVITPLLSIIAFVKKNKMKATQYLKMMLGSLLLIVMAVFISPADNIIQNDSRGQSELIQQTSKEVSSSESDVPNYVEDKVINNFIVSYNSKSSEPLTNFKEGRTAEENFAVSKGYSFRLQNSDATDAIYVDIN